MQGHAADSAGAVDGVATAEERHSQSVDDVDDRYSVGVVTTTP